MPERLTIHTLARGRRYRVVARFVDHYGGEFEVGDELTFVEAHFLPYHGGHTLVFTRPDGTERRMYFQEELQYDLIAALGEHLNDVTGA